MPPATAATVKHTAASNARPAADKAQAGADRDGTADHQTPAPFDSGATLGGLVVLQPHPHAGLANGIDDGCRRQRWPRHT